MLVVIHGEIKTDDRTAYLELWEEFAGIFYTARVTRRAHLFAAELIKS